MLNHEKIKILKENIFVFIQNTKNFDENHIFEYAKQQAKEMRIEISKGELKSIIYVIIYTITSSKNNFSEFLYNDECCKSIDNTIEKFEFTTFNCHLNI